LGCLTNAYRDKEEVIGVFCAFFVRPASLILKGYVARLLYLVSLVHRIVSSRVLVVLLYLHCIDDIYYL
jgi:hypothetical protein